MKVTCKKDKEKLEVICKWMVNNHNVFYITVIIQLSLSVTTCREQHRFPYCGWQVSQTQATDTITTL